MTQELRRGADNAEIYSIAFNKSSTLIACSSDKGTLHIYNLTHAFKGNRVEQVKEEAKKSSEGDIYKEVKESNEVKDIKDTKEVKEAKEAKEIKNPTSFLSFMKSIVPYFEGELSFAIFKIPNNYSVISFGPDDKNIIISIYE